MYKNDSLMDENQIIAYLNGQLSPEEELAFEAQINADPELKKEVSAHESIIKALRHKEYNNFLSKVKAFEKTLPRIEEKEEAVSVPVINPEPAEKQGIIRRLAPWIAVAASIVLLIIAVPYFSKQSDYNGFTTFYIKPAFVKFASGEENISNFDRGLNQFKKDSINQAILSLKAIDSKSDLYIDAQYVIAHCYYILKNYSEALQYIKRVEGKEAQLSLAFGEEYLPIDEKELKWFKTLCLLGDGQKKAARVLLNKIIDDPNHPYQQKASEIRATL